VLSHSNILIYAAHPGETRFNQYLRHPDACISEVTRIEVLGFPGFHSLALFRQTCLIELLTDIVELLLERLISDRAIELRRQRRMSLADSIIAATALLYDFPLVTRNVDDFKHISGLQLINPFSAPIP
jgi:predicted nucleic acid-binding protein